MNFNIDIETLIKTRLEAAPSGPSGPNVTLNAKDLAESVIESTQDSIVNEAVEKIPKVLGEHFRRFVEKRSEREKVKTYLTNHFQSHMDYADAAINIINDTYDVFLREINKINRDNKKFSVIVTGQNGRVDQSEYPMTEWEKANPCAWIVVDFFYKKFCRCRPMITIDLELLFSCDLSNFNDKRDAGIKPLICNSNEISNPGIKTIHLGKDAGIKPLICNSNEISNPGIKTIHLGKETN